CFFFQAEDGIRDFHVTGVQTCALPISTLLASAMKKPSAAEVATALWMGTLPRTMKGTDKNPPPAPTRPEAKPITTPMADVPNLPGMLRSGAGGRPHIMRAAE